jgi:hypothetical protein
LVDQLRFVGAALPTHKQESPHLITVESEESSSLTGETRLHDGVCTEGFKVPDLSNKLLDHGESGMVLGTIASVLLV